MESEIEDLKNSIWKEISNVLKSANNPYKAGVEDIVHFIKSEGFIPIQRNTFYEKIKVY